MKETTALRYGPVCPECGSRTRVIDSRMALGGVRRRRVCKDNKHRFTSYESMIPADQIEPRLTEEDFAEIRASVERVLRRAPRLAHAIAAQPSSLRAVSK